MQGPRSKFSSGGGGLKKNAWRKIFMLNYFLFNLFLFLQKSGGGGAKAPPAPPSARSLTWLIVINSGCADDVKESCLSSSCNKKWNNLKVNTS